MIHPALLDEDLMEIEWSEVPPDRHQAWSWSGVLYAYGTPDREIFYVGKADGAYSTLRSRWNATDKEKLWRRIERERGVYHHFVLVGVPILQPGRRLSRELLADAESLIINRIRPWGNKSCLRSRTTRPGLVVRCSGYWPGPRWFEDA